MKLTESVRRKLLQISVAISASTVYLTAGLSIGWAAPMLPRLNSEDSHFSLSPDETSWIVAIIGVGCAAGVLLLPFMTKSMGRKIILIITAIINIVAWVILIFAVSVEALYAGRFLFGIAIILAFAIGPTYLTEISEVSIRGILSSLPQLFYNIGAMIEYCIIPYVSYTLVGVISIIFPIISFMMLIFVPESPYFLLYTGKEGKAVESLMQLRGQVEKQNVQEEFITIKEAVEKSQCVQTAPVKELFLIRGNRRAFIIVLVLVALQQFSGQLAIISYSTQIMERTTSSLNADISVIIFGGVQTVASIVMSTIVDRIGRRPLLITSTSGLTLSCFLFAIYFYLDYYTIYDLSAIGWLPLTSLILYMSSFCLALGILPYTILGEVIPINVKGLAASIVLMIHSISGIVITKIFQIMTDDSGPDSPFWLFLVFNLAGTIFTIWYVPETMGKTFSEIYRELNEDTYPRRTKKDIQITGTGNKIINTVGKT